MKKTTLILGLAVLIFVSAGFECSFTTAALSDLKFSKNKDGSSPATSFGTGEDVYAVVEAAGLPSGKHSLSWKVTYDNVTGKKKDEEVGKQKMDLTQASQVWTQFSSPLPGDYKIEATLADETGKMIATKTGIVKITGIAPAASETDDKESEDEDKKDDKK